MEFANEIGLACKTIIARRDDVSAFQNAVAGRYEIGFGSSKFRSYMSKHFSKLADNLSQRVVGCLNDRLQVTSIEPYNADQNQKDQLSLLFRQYRYDGLSKRLHHSALRDGSAFLVVTEGPTKVNLHLQTADVFELARDEESQDILAGVKLWVDSAKNQRLTVYYADRIERYVSNQKLLNTPFTEFRLDSFQLFDDGNPGIIPHSLGRVPCFAFLNQPDERLRGISELTSVLPIQLSLNAALVNLMAAAESWSLPTRYITGLLTEYDENGLPVRPDPSAGSTWIFGDGDISIGQLPGADLRMSIEMINDLRQEIARVSGIPQHCLLLTTSYPSGESLRVAESSLIGKLRDRQVSFGNSHEDVFACLINSDEPLNCRWREAEIVSQMDTWQSAVLQRNTGVSLRQTLLERGYTAPEVELIIADREDEDRARAELTAQFFNSGATPQDPLLNDTV